MMTNFPVAGVVWQTVHYLIGLQRLGYDVYYVETHACTPTKLMERPEDDGPLRAANYVAGVMERFGFGDRWAFFDPNDNDRCFGLSRRQLLKLYDSASLLINLHAGTLPLPELVATERLVLLETDPVEVQVELYDNRQQTVDFLEAHCALFTFGENYGNFDCKLPVLDRFEFRATRQPVVLDFWQDGPPAGPADTFTTVGNWRQEHRLVTLDGKTYGWSKHDEFFKFLDVPERTGQAFELALSSYEQEDRRMLERKGFRVRHAMDFSRDTEDYREYIRGSRGEFTVAKDQNVRLRTGWFSDRSATYLAAGRPVISQETGFSNILPTGEGLFGFSTMDEIVEAVEGINADYARHSRAAETIARECFSHDVVLSRLLSETGVELATGRRGRRGRRGISYTAEAFPPDMVITPLSRKPIRLPDTTVETTLLRPVPYFSDPALAAGGEGEEGRKRVSIVVVTHDNLVFTRLCLESLLANTRNRSYEVIVVDNASTDGTAAYLRRLAENHPHVRFLLNEENRGFARACNQGLSLASGAVLVLLNNDTMVPPGWLETLISKLRDPTVGLVGPVTNRIANEAEVETSYDTWREFLKTARERSVKHAGKVFELSMLMMFCTAIRRKVYERIGPLDEQFEVGMLEDDDYAMRVRKAGLRIVCAEDVLVHHFGEASLGKLVSSGGFDSALEANRKRFEEKWGVTWQPPRHRPGPGYRRLTDRIRRVVAENLPPDATILVVSRGDDELLKLNGHPAWHFPSEGAGYAGHYPADSDEAVMQLEALRAKGGEYILFPKPSLWWLEHYKGFQEHLERRYRAVVSQKDTCMVFALSDREQP
jgi:GT2 family glycosyltransferase